MEATYRKIDKSKYSLKTYSSFEECSNQVQNDLKQINETAQPKGDTYKINRVEAIPFNTGVRAYFEKANLS